MEIGNLIAKGHTSEVFYYGNKYVLKLLKPTFDDLCEKEYKNYTLLRNSDLLIPKCYDMIEINGRKGLVLDYIQGENFTTYIKKNPVKFNSMLYKFTNTFLEIIGLDLDVKIENNERNDSYINKLRKAHKIRPEITNYLIDKLQNDNFDNIFIHGDYNPLNVIIRDEKIFIIDFATSTFSDLEQDLAKFGAIYMFSDYSRSTSGLTGYLSQLYRPFIYKSFLSNLDRNILIVNNKMTFWSIVHISIATDEMENQKKINSNIKFIEKSFRLLNK